MTIVRFIGSTVESYDTRQLLYNICLQIALFLDAPRDVIPNEYKELQQYFYETLAAFPDDKNLVIFLDSLNTLVPQYNAHYLYWLPKLLNENVKIIVSTLPDVDGDDVSASSQHLLQRLRNEVVQSDNNFVELPPLQLSECLQLLRMRLELEHRRLQPDQEAIVSEAFRRCSYPLYVELMLTEVRHWRSSSDDEPPTPLPVDMRQFIHYILDKLETTHGAVMASRAAAYLTASTTGMSDSEMEDLLSLDDEVSAHAL